MIITENLIWSEVLHVVSIYEAVCKRYGALIMVAALLAYAALFAAYHLGLLPHAMQPRRLNWMRPTACFHRNC